MIRSKKIFLPGLIVMISAVGFFSFDIYKSNEMQGSDINWFTWEEALAQSAQDKQTAISDTTVIPKKFVVFVTASWCHACKVMKSTTFQDEAVVSYMNELYYPIYFDAYTKEDITIGDKVYKYVENDGRGYHELAASLLGGKMSFPTSVFLNRNLDMIQPVKGAHKAPTYMQILKYLGDDSVNRKMSFEEFQKNFEKYK